MAGSRGSAIDEKHVMPHHWSASGPEVSHIRRHMSLPAPFSSGEYSANPAKESVPWENHAFPPLSSVVFPMSTASAPSRSEFATTMHIIPVVFFTFLCYLTIGIPLAV